MKVKIRGFTLLEVLLALVIAGLGATVLFEVTASSAQRGVLSNERQLGLLLAKSKLSELGWQLEPNEELRGTFQNGMNWLVTFDRVSQGPQLTLVETTVTVTFGTQTPVRLTTLRWIQNGE